MINDDVFNIFVFVFFVLKGHKPQNNQPNKLNLYDCILYPGDSLPTPLCNSGGVSPVNKLKGIEGQKRMTPKSK